MNLASMRRSLTLRLEMEEHSPGRDELRAAVEGLGHPWLRVDYKPKGPEIALYIDPEVFLGFTNWKAHVRIRLAVEELLLVIHRDTPIRRAFFDWRRY